MSKIITEVLIEKTIDMLKENLEEREVLLSVLQEAGINLNEIGKGTITKTALKVGGAIAGIGAGAGLGKLATNERKKIRDAKDAAVKSKQNWKRAAVAGGVGLGGLSAAGLYAAYKAKKKAEESKKKNKK